MQSAGKDAEAAATLLEYALPGPRYAGLRRIAGPVFAALLRRSSTPVEDLVVETEAEAAYDARHVLERIRRPVLFVCAGSDRFFPVSFVEETAAAIPGASLITYPGIGHVQLFGDKRLPNDVMDWLRSPPAEPRE